MAHPVYMIKIQDKYLDFLQLTIKTKEEQDAFLDKIKNPEFIFHFKLLNVFTKEELEFIVKECFAYYPKLNL